MAARLPSGPDNVAADLARMLDIEIARCPICNHPDRAVIERSLRSGVQIGWLLEKYGIAPNSVAPARHVGRHVPELERRDFDPAYSDVLD